MTEKPFLSNRLMRCMDAGGLARVVLDTEYDGITRHHASVFLRNKLRDFQGAMWLGAPMSDRADVIRALRVIERIEEAHKRKSA
jgi:hypothetical protein